MFVVTVTHQDATINVGPFSSRLAAENWMVRAQADFPDTVMVYYPLAAPDELRDSLSDTLATNNGVYP